MATLPTQGSSTTWGTTLNTWLQVEHDSSGSHDDSTFKETLGEILSDIIMIHEGDVLTHNGEIVWLT